MSAAAPPGSPTWRPAPRRHGLPHLRRPSLFWLGTVALAALTSALAWSWLTTARQARAAWGTVEQVVVVRAPIAAGESLDPSALVLAERPAVAVPPTALRVLPHDRRAAVDLVPGEVLVADRVAPAGAGPVAARLPPQSVAVGVRLDVPVLPLAPGDRVDVLALPRDDTSTRAAPLVRAAPVVDVNEAGVSVAVPEADAPRVAREAADGTLAVVLAAPAPGP